MRLERWFLAAVVAGVGAAIVAPATAQAHPLGNFSVNHLNALSFEVSQIINDAVVDIAEIPTAQELPAVDLDGDGETSADELGQYGTRRCADLARAQSLTVDGDPVPFLVVSASFVHVPGQAGLPTGRLECRLHASVDLSVARTVAFDDQFEAGRVGWREITAVGAGIQLVDPPVGTTSATDGLRLYPVDLLASPLAIQQATFSVRPDQTATAAAQPASTPTTGDAPGAVAAPDTHLGGLGPLTGVRDHLTGTFDDLIARRDLTIGVGLLAVTLAAILGASHALLPGHGKTVMAAYIAGRQGSIKDAVVVGASVTGTHTGGVLTLGLALTLSTSLAGEAVIGWLGVASGLLIALLGGALLVGILRRRGHHDRPARHSHGPLGHHHHATNHGHEDEHHHGPGHRHEHESAVTHRPVGASGHRHASHQHHEDRDHLVGHDTMTETEFAHDAQGHDLAVASPISPVDNVHDQPSTPTRAYSRRGLIGMGIAGGLVPSPSALIILLSAIALGRTAFGILLVVAYGLGMALTLTVAGIALVVVRDRYNDRLATSSGRTRAIARRWTTIAPYGTALLVIIVGAGLAIRSLSIV